MTAGVDHRFGLYSAIVVTLVASIFGSSSHLINGPTNAISLVVFSSLVGFDVRFDAAKAGESGHSVLVPPRLPTRRDGGPITRGLKGARRFGSRHQEISRAKSKIGRFACFAQLTTRSIAAAVFEPIPSTSHNSAGVAGNAGSHRPEPLE